MIDDRCTGCPDDTHMADYLDGCLPEHQRKMLETHISHCGQCQQWAVAVLKAQAEADDPEVDAVPAQVTQSARQAVAAALAAGRPPGLHDGWGRLKKRLQSYLTPPRQLSAAPVRSQPRQVTDKPVVLKKSFNGVTVEIEIERIAASEAQLRFRLIAKRDDTRIRANLYKDQREICSYPLAPGAWISEQISFGRYRLELITNGHRLGTYPFEIKETIDGG
jgi:hypothetical protein